MGPLTLLVLTVATVSVHSVTGCEPVLQQALTELAAALQDAIDGTCPLPCPPTDCPDPTEPPPPPPTEPPPPPPTEPPPPPPTEPPPPPPTEPPPPPPTEPPPPPPTEPPPPPPTEPPPPPPTEPPTDAPFLTGFDCPENTIKALDVSYDTCKAKCAELRICKGFVYTSHIPAIEINNGPCVLKKRDPFCPTRVPQPDTNVYKKIQKPKAPAATESWEEITQPPTHYTLAGSGITCPGHTLKVQEVPFEACAKACYAKIECAGFEYTLLNAATACTLKAAGVCEDDTSPKDDTVVMMKGDIVEEDLEVPPPYFETASESGINCPGNDLKVYNNLKANCLKECQRLSECVGFVYSTNPEFGDRCHLKKDSICEGETPYLTDTYAFRKLEHFNHGSDTEFEGVE